MLIARVVALLSLLIGIAACAIPHSVDWYVARPAVAKVAQTVAWREAIMAKTAATPRMPSFGSTASKASTEDRDLWRSSQRQQAQTVPTAHVRSKQTPAPLRKDDIRREARARAPILTGQPRYPDLDPSRSLGVVWLVVDPIAGMVRPVARSASLVVGAIGRDFDVIIGSDVP